LVEQQGIFLRQPVGTVEAGMVVHMQQRGNHHTDPAQFGTEGKQPLGILAILFTGFGVGADQRSP
jgi:hypothetical protein